MHNSTEVGVKRAAVWRLWHTRCRSGSKALSVQGGDGKGRKKE